MTDSRRVYPRQALEAHMFRYFGGPQERWTLSVNQYLTDAEFAAHFVPADAFDRLIAAVGHAVETFAALPEEWDIDDATLWAADFDAVCAAFRAYRQQDEQ